MISFSCKKDIPISYVSINPPTLSMPFDALGKLKLEIEPAGAIDPVSIQWISSDDKIVKVDATGAIETIKPGKAIITVIVDGQIKGSCEVTVIGNHITIGNTEYPINNAILTYFSDYYNVGAKYYRLYLDYTTPFPSNDSLRPLRTTFQFLTKEKIDGFYNLNPMLIAGNLFYASYTVDDGTANIPPTIFTSGSIDFFKISAKSEYEISFEGVCNDGVKIDGYYKGFVNYIGQ
jgi:hypothetical protein